MDVLIQLNKDIFPANLVYLRKKRRLSQKSLARQMGLSVYYLRGLENGRIVPLLQYGQYRCICDILQTSPTEMGTVVLSTTDPNRLIAGGNHTFTKNTFPTLGIRLNS